MNGNQDALMMEFRDEATAALAADTFDELGYEPYLHGGGRLHIHVRNEDLTSALEIMQCHGGQILDGAHADAYSLTQMAYDLDAIPIPAHTVNEDWVDGYDSGAPAATASDEAANDFQDAPYDHFDAT